MAQHNYNVNPPVAVERPTDDTSGIWAVMGIVILLILGYFLFFAGRDNQNPGTTIEQNQTAPPATQTEPAPEPAPRP